MKSGQPDSHSDEWSEWLLRHRHADDTEFALVVRAWVQGYADRVLDNARLASGMTLADIGSGDGLIALRAIERIGPSLRVLAADISAPLLRHLETLVKERGVGGQCTFFHCGADKLEGIADGSVDVVATRAVLAYVADKRGALREFHRILRPGGRISLAEPILRDEALYARGVKEVLDSTPLESRERFMPLLHRWKAAQYPDTEEAIAKNPITNYSERDLFRLALDSGFSEVHLELHIDIDPTTNASWEVFAGSSPHPLAPSLRTIMAQRFSLEEREFFEQILRPTVEQGLSPTLSRVAYLTAKKPAALIS